MKLIVILILLELIPLYMLIRNQWVFAKQQWLNAFWYAKSTACLDMAKRASGSAFEDLLAEADWWRGYPDEYADYGECMLKFWVWDFEKFHYNPRPKLGSMIQ